MIATLETLRRSIEHAPKDPGKLATNLVGWVVGEGVYVCASCAGRIIARGCHLPRPAEPVWSDAQGAAMDCALCATGHGCEFCGVNGAADCSVCRASS